MKEFFDLLDEGHKAGESLQDFRNRLKGSGGEFEALVTDEVLLHSDKLGNNGSCVKNWVAPCKLEIVSITAVKTSSADTATATMTAAGNNPLAAANVNMHGLTNDTPAAQTLNSTAANKQMAAGTQFKCTFACGASGTLDGGAIAIKYKPINS